MGRHLSESVNVVPMSLGENVKRLRDKNGWSQKDLARLAGVSQPTIANIETGASTTSKHLFKLAKVFGVPVTELDPDIGAVPSLQQKPLLSGGIVSTAADFPIYAAAEGGAGAVIITWEPIQYTPRPAPLVNVRGGYGIFVVGDSMVPAYYPGQIALVNPNLPPAPGEDVVLFRADGGNSTEGLIKRLVKVTSKEWHVVQHNPSKTFALSRADWPQCQIVVGRYNR